MYFLYCISVVDPSLTFICSQDYCKLKHNVTLETGVYQGCSAPHGLHDIMTSGMNMPPSHACAVCRWLGRDPHLPPKGTGMAPLKPHLHTLQVAREVFFGQL